MNADAGVGGAEWDWILLLANKAVPSKTLLSRSLNPQKYLVSEELFEHKFIRMKRKRLFH